MRKRIRRSGKLIQKKKQKEIPIDDVSQRTAMDGKFRIIATSGDLEKAWIEGEYDTFKEAKQVVDSFSNSDISYYVHSNSSRVLYYKNGK